MTARAQAPATAGAGSSGPTAVSSQGVVRRPSEDLVALVDELKELRYCSLEEFDRRAADLARRLMNAEQTAWDAVQVLRGKEALLGGVP